ncbi:YopX family protein [Paenibacillus radicis (ex Xue et al. 2023)]|uniref:YopX family protein n=1 Tax=Paenibacillus radicis (ex Xue et al. 2023) TaxID=2972489 RepID=A0ABT1YJW8_9BACL|nr:YopX family protein [Paenibacillus radicis (ex Xue et al. 2023)]MCR8633466.1 YopX family protein [Paenibacillus radicis (ex Xue et al. 2023)]
MSTDIKDMQPVKKFRGKRFDNGEWVHGSLIGNDIIVGNIVEWDSEYFCTEFWLKVYPVTVGQFNGYFGLNFFEGDIMAIACDCDSEYGCTHGDGIYEIVWDYEAAGFGIKKNGRIWSLDNYGVENMRIVGNRFDNPELLKRE